LWSITASIKKWNIKTKYDIQLDEVKKKDTEDASKDTDKKQTQNSTIPQTTPTKINYDYEYS
jgi:hypothetical protein